MNHFFHKKIMRMMVMLQVMVGATLSMNAVEVDPYAAWANGRPTDAIPALYQQAQASDRWDAWYDCGLAAGAAGDKGRAAVWLLAAHHRAPERAEPRHALIINGTPLPASWLDKIGPVALPGLGIPGVIVLLCAGLSIGWACTGRRGRGWTAVVGTLLVLITVPGIVGMILDGHTHYAAAVRDTHLLDSSGNPVVALPAGTIVIQHPGEAWAGRLVVSIPNGQRGLIAQSDIVAQP